MNLYTRGRHANISTIMLLQHLKGALLPALRSQSTMVLLATVSSQSTLLDLLNEFSSGAGKSKKEALDNMYSYYLQAMGTRNGYGFLCINTERLFGEGRITHNILPKDQDHYYDKVN